MSTALIRLDWQQQSASVTRVAVALKNEALAASALLSRVNDAASQEVAVAAQRKLAELCDIIEKARKAAKDPALQFGRRIDAAAQQFIIELKEELGRISTLIGDFQQIEQARVRAAQQAENERLTALERERAKAIAEAQTHEQIDKIQEQFNTRAAQEAPAEPIVPTRAAGQRIQEDWEIVVTDIHALYRHHPNCVTLSPLVGEIKALLKAGTQVKGVTAKKIVKASVTRSRLPGAIDVQSQAA